MRRLFLVGIAIIAVLSFGCGNDTSDNDEYASDDDAISALIENTSYADYSSSYTDDSFGSGNVGGDIDPLCWWRKPIRPFDKKKEITYDGNTATVVVTKYHKGYLFIRTSNDTISKDLNDVGVRTIYLEKSSTETAYRGWMIKKITGVALDSPGNTLSIKSVRLQWADKDTTITSASELFDVANIMNLPPNIEIKITITGPAESDIVYVHTCKKNPKQGSRAPFTYNSETKVFEGTWYTPDDTGRYHVFFDVMTHETLYTDDSPYTSKGWAFPYDLEY